MGIRVHKSVGWMDIEFYNPPVDFHDKVEELWDMTAEDFLKWCKEHEEEILSYRDDLDARSAKMAWYLFEATITEDHKNDRYRPSEMITFDDEFGLEAAIMITPLEMIKQCKRYDDLIDWLEEQEHCNPRFQWLIRGIYPLEEQEHYNPRFQWLTRGIYPFEFGKVPLSVIGVCLYLNIEEVIPRLSEGLYVYWS